MFYFDYNTYIIVNVLKRHIEDPFYTLQQAYKQNLQIMFHSLCTAASTYYTFDNRTLNYIYFSKKQTRSFRTRTTHTRSPNVLDVIVIRILSHAASAVYIL